MSTEQILLYAALVLGGIGIVCLGTAIYMYFTYNIPDIRDDLSGKKRAEAIASMDEPGTGVIARRKRANARAERAQQKLAAEQTGNVDPLAPPEQMSQVSPAPAPAPAQSFAEPIAERPVQQGRVADNRPMGAVNANDGATTVLEADETPTAVLGLDEEQTTVLGEMEEETTVYEDEQTQAGALGTSQVAYFEEDEDLTSTLTDTADQTTRLYGSPLTDMDSADTFSSQTTSTVEVAPMRTVPDYFTVVQKVVLTGSDDFLKVEQGEGHA